MTHRAGNCPLAQRPAGTHYIEAPRAGVQAALDGRLYEVHSTRPFPRRARCSRAGSAVAILAPPLGGGAGSRGSGRGHGDPGASATPNPAGGGHRRAVPVPAVRSVRVRRPRRSRRRCPRHGSRRQSIGRVAELAGVVLGGDLGHGSSTSSSIGSSSPSSQESSGSGARSVEPVREPADAAGPASSSSGLGEQSIGSSSPSSQESSSTRRRPRPLTPLRRVDRVELAELAGVLVDLVADRGRGRGSGSAIGVEPAESATSHDDHVVDRVGRRLLDARRDRHGRLRGTDERRGGDPVHGRDGRRRAAPAISSPTEAVDAAPATTHDHATPPEPAYEAPAVTAMGDYAGPASEPATSDRDRSELAVVAGRHLRSPGRHADGRRRDAGEQRAGRAHDRSELAVLAGGHLRGSGGHADG